ncbi:carboxymuconolactone decarboxylase family protein [Sphingomicrobium astaxanthinifaciens]|uniref:carboxymuconolactone decarboxylase family protein n=1 Tax=Sphingomicrobium astaxanthinifaciens TaxID=1227949 RepID=UPI001FCBB001|nr:carboxymuconolactone decarboxylase family protein [Sphingomicrobium astaxanthinifaciens]MCJ7421847.1 carboxymuconolactone decarboxylase family protein [Sphingomicrobium astaxanthinifaciens]
MSALKDFAGAMPAYAKDLKLNLSSLLTEQGMGEARKYGLLLACAHGTGYKPLVEAAEADCADKLDEKTADAARGAAAVMAMNNVYYRFTHLAGNENYAAMPAKLRMNMIATHGVAKEEFELFSLAVSAINGCGLCIDSHEKVLLKHEVKEADIQTAVRIAAVMKALATVHATL